MSTPQQADTPQIIAERGGVPVTVPFPSAGAGQICTGIGLILAVTFANFSATTPVHAVLRDGTDTTGPMLAQLAAVAAGNDGVYPCEPGIYFGTGLYLQVTVGACLGTVTYIPLLNPLK